MGDDGHHQPRWRGAGFLATSEVDEVVTSMATEYRMQPRVGRSVDIVVVGDRGSTGAFVLDNNRDLGIIMPQRSRSAEPVWRCDEGRSFKAES